MTEPRRIDVAAAAARLKAARRIVITTHARADGDAVGCAAALGRILRQQAKDAAVYVHEPVLDRYTFLLKQPASQQTAHDGSAQGTDSARPVACSAALPASRVPCPAAEDGGACDAVCIWDVAKAADVIAGADLLVLVDTCSASQLGKIAEAVQRAPVAKLAIDHHVTRDGIVDEILLDETAGACAQIILALCERAGWEIDASAAAMLYAALATDTGWFRFSNADGAVFEAAARLVAAGARPNELYEPLYLNDCEARMRLIGAVLGSFELLAEGRLAVIRVTQEMLARCGATREMTEEIINEPQRIGSVVACLLLVEPADDGPVRVSFRSKRGVDVAAIASRFGGGGHERAAGARIPGTIESVARQVLPVLLDAVEVIR